MKAMKPNRGIKMLDRVYLYVPFEDNGKVRALGARWDFERKCWYIDARQRPGPFRCWLTEPGVKSLQGEEYSIVSEQACVALARTRCWKCRASIEVACVYCQSGWVDGDRCEEFTVSNISAIDESLRRQLERWPLFRFRHSNVVGGRCLVNHCPHCRAPQADYYLHCEPDGAFFTLKGAPSGAIALEKLSGRVCMEGDQGFEP
jgi:Domain of unknown function (DUF5710)